MSKDVIQNNYFSNILDFALKIPDEEFANLKGKEQPCISNLIEVTAKKNVFD